MKRTCNQATQGHAEAEMARDLAQQQATSLTSKLHELQVQFAEVQQQRQRLQEQLDQQHDKQKHQEQELLLGWQKQQEQQKQQLEQQAQQLGEQAQQLDQTRQERRQLELELEQQRNLLRSPVTKPSPARAQLPGAAIGELKAAVVASREEYVRLGVLQERARQQRFREEAAASLLSTHHHAATGNGGNSYPPVPLQPPH